MESTALVPVAVLLLASLPILARFDAKKRVLEALRLRHRLASIYSYVSFGMAVLRNHLHDDNETAIPLRQKTLQEFATFVIQSGIYEKLQEGFLNARVLTNFIILHRVHKILYKEIIEEPTTIANNNDSNNNKHEMETAYRIFKFSVVIYGHDVQRAVEFETALQPKSARHKRQSQILCEQTGVCKAADILVRNWEYGGNPNYTNHTVVIDHAFEQVIFAIRGTLSLSDALVDLEANAVDFCGGLAHAGMARMARLTWQAATEKQWEGEVPDHYELVITGHSLGAGVATLISIMVLYEQLVQRPVRCFAYAPPATFHGNLLKEVSCRILAFSFGNDFVSDFSVYNTVRLNSMLAAVDKHRSAMSFTETWKLVAGWLRPSTELLDAVDNCAGDDTLPGAPPLKVVAQKFLWFRKTKHGFCVSDRSRGGPMILSGLDMLTHHTPGKYEKVFQAIVNAPQSSFTRRLSRFMPKQISQRFFE